jgi:hypothetical protein
MRQRIEASSTGITATSARGRVRHIDAADVRQVHAFIDASGDQGLVVRKSLLRFVYVPLEALRDPAVAAGIRHLVDHVRAHARIDAHVERHLGHQADDTLLAA